MIHLLLSYFPSGFTRLSQICLIFQNSSHSLIPALHFFSFIYSFICYLFTARTFPTEESTKNKWPKHRFLVSVLHETNMPVIVIQCRFYASKNTEATSLSASSACQRQKMCMKWKFSQIFINFSSEFWEKGRSSTTTVGTNQVTLVLLILFPFKAFVNILIIFCF